ncbi:proteasome assembly chaperone family protein [Candidatus Aenigmatarchaeota archaeon]
METQIKVLKNVKFKNPVLIEGLPGIGNVGRVAVGYITHELKLEKFAEVYSPHFLPLVIIHDDSVADVLKFEFYYMKTKKRDIIILTGDTQSISPEGHYDVCNKVIDFCAKLGVKEIVTLGGFTEGREVTDPRVIGAVNDKALLKKYEKYDIDFGKEHTIGTIVGASGLLLGLGKLKNMKGLCLMGETFDLPLLTDPKAADRILQVLKKMFGIKIDLSKLEKTIKEMEQKIKKTEDIYKKMLQHIPKKDDQVRYIG